jgi:PAS domain S-box-containing protein
VWSGKDELSQVDQALHLTAAQIAEREMQLRHANRLLEEAARKEKALINNSLDTICSIDAEGKFVDVSPACLRLWGYEVEELIGRRYIDLVVPEDVERTLATASEMIAGKAVSGFENRYRRKDGTVVDLMWSAMWSEPEQLTFCVARDITERKEVERLKNEFISTVNHELRTPLTSLRGFTELLLKKKITPEKQQHYLTIIFNETQRLTNLINDFLDIQRIESGSQTYYFEPIDISPLLHEVIFLFAPNHRQHEFDVDVPDSLPLVWADADRIRQVLFNLVSNAVKYSPDPGKIQVSVGEQETTIKVSVADQGIGIPSAAMSKLFTKFYRADNAATRKIGGTGLGLSLVKAIVEAHHGTIEVDSEPGRGSTFSFIAVAILFRTFLWTRGARPQKCPCPNRSGGCYIYRLISRTTFAKMLSQSFGCS